MKIVHILHSIDKSTGGPARSVTQTCVELAKLGMQVDLIVQDSFDKIEVESTPNLTIHYKTISELFIYGSKLSKDAVDLIHLQHIWSPYIEVIAFWAYHKNIPYIISTRGMLEPWIMAHNPWRKKLGMLLYQDSALKKASYLHVTALMEQKTVRELGYTNPVAIVPNGLDLKQVKKVKEQYGSKKIVFLSRIHPKKGIELLLEAWKQIENCDWSLEIAGNGDPSYVKSLRDNADGIERVTFVGEKYGEAKWDFLRAADAMVLPTYSENFGNVVVEALAVGVPVLTTKGTPWEDLVTDNCGWWIDLSVENLADSLKKIIKTPVSALEEKGINGRRLVGEKYNFKVVGNAFADLYHKILIKNE